MKTTKAAWRDVDGRVRLYPTDCPANPYQVDAHFFRLLSMMEDMGANDMGDLSYREAQQFHKATDLIRAIATRNRAGG